jgi:peptidoglycan/LPS O-acetylase OafA/YrhL
MAGLAALSLALPADDLPKVLVYLPHVLLGILLARHRAAAVRALQALPRAGRLGLWVLSYLLFQVRWLTPAPDRVCDWATGLGAALLMALVLASPRVQAFLCRRPLAWLGEVSYSLYLAHLPVLLSILHLAPAHLPPALLMLPVLPISLLLAALLHRWVERPAMDLGRRLAARIDGRRAWARGAG